MLNLLWLTYKSLFTLNDQRLKLLKEQIPGFAGLIRETLADAVTLGICRVTDPARPGHMRDLTLDQLLQSLSPPPGAGLRTGFPKRKQKSTARFPI